MTEEQIKHLVDRFLMWKLPEDFSPDGGVEYTPAFNEYAPDGPVRWDVYGTNLLDAQQAEAMVRHMVAGLPGA